MAARHDLRQHYGGNRSQHLIIFKCVRTTTGISDGVHYLMIEDARKVIENKV